MYYLFHPNYLPTSHRHPAHWPFPQYPSPMYQAVNHPATIQNRPIIQQTNPPGQQPSNEYQYPPVDSNLLYQSANQTKELMEEASVVLDKLASSKEFDTLLMYHAQRSDTEAVNQLIQNLGIKSKVDVKFNPDGLHLDFESKVENRDCCKLLIILRWR